jgi:ATP-dependent helicase/nuclease subunit A
VIRLLLSGVDPARILCLTFTKTAAAEMSTRVFAELGRWTRLGDRELAQAIADLEGRPALGAELVRARQLFPRALDVPGGLKIQTIHAFCERLLHQFPFEANVAGDFEVLDERSQAALMAESRRAVLGAAASDPLGMLGAALKTVLTLVSDFTHETSLAEFIDKRDAILAWFAVAGSLEAALSELRARLSLPAGETAQDLRRRLLAEAALSPPEAAELAARLARGGSSDCAAGTKLAKYVTASDPDLAALAYLDFFRTEGGEFRSNVVTKKILQERPGLEQLFDREIARLEALLDRIKTAELYESTGAMLRLAKATIDEYERRKRRRSLLDFEDLIVSSVQLLSSADAARWVQYKLDRGIDHILVDEAQDTSPRQWQVVRALVEEFFAGEGAAGASRSIFAVGDEKQSIFSFQGAAPAWFAAMRREFGGRARDADLPWQERELHLSFRSVPVILDAVDRVFEDDAARAGLTADGGPITHTARRAKEPGRVVLWPAIAPPEKPEIVDWATPVDHLAVDSPEQTLARRIAQTIRGWLNRGEILDAAGADGEPRPIRPGQILILVRNRGALSDAVNRQLRTERVPIAGADRMTLTEHIAVMDLCAVGRVVLTPEDDLSLAALLKSPLIGLDEDALFALAARRKRTLWEALAEHAAAAPAGVYGQTKERIDQWRAMADQRDPHAFFARVLAGPTGRVAFQTRLGTEVLDVLDEFLVQTLQFEESNTPSLEGFLDWLQSSETEIQRDPDALRDEIRVMTVHGAKGLEADIVFLVDGGMPPWLAMHDPRLVSLEDRGDPDDPGPLVWNRSIKAMPVMVRDRIERDRAKSEEEYRRLLYVGMTRARDRLYVVGIDKRPPKDAASDRRWHAIVSRALGPALTLGNDEYGQPYGEWHPEQRSAAVAPPPSKASPTALPDWARTPAPLPPARLNRLAPSSVETDGTPPPRPFPTGGADGVASLRRGELIHRLLQSLPDVAARHRASVGIRYLAAVSGLSAEDQQEILGKVLAVLDHDGLHGIFADGSWAEIDIAGTVETAAGPAEISGRIDRLAVTQTHVLIVDYKSNRPPPGRLEDVPPAYLAQLALYRMVLRKLYPGRMVEAGLLWTEVPSLMVIPPASLDATERAVLCAGQRPSP